MARIVEEGEACRKGRRVEFRLKLLHIGDCFLILTEGDKLAGLNLLLMAGQQSMPARDKQAIMAHVLERRMTSPDLMGANSALLQLAEVSRAVGLGDLCSLQRKAQKCSLHFDRGD